MEIDIIEEADNPMLHRTDVRFEVTHEEATPSRLSVRDSLAAMLNKDAEEVVVHELDTKFGMRQTVGYAKVYESPEHAQEVEQDHMLQRNKIAADGEGGAVEAEAEAEAAEEAEPEADEEADEAEAETEEEAADAEDEEAADEEEGTADEEDAPEAEEA